jgi:hypothetical protein
VVLGAPLSALRMLPLRVYRAQSLMMSRALGWLSFLLKLLSLFRLSARVLRRLRLNMMMWLMCAVIQHTTACCTIQIVDMIFMKGLLHKYHKP